MIPVAWLDGWRRVFAAPAVIAGVFLLSVLLALPLMLTMRGLLRAHLGPSAAAAQAADAVNYDWWQEFTGQASGLGATFTPAVIGFASTLDVVSGLLDGRVEGLPVMGAVAIYLAGWMLLSGGIIDRYARQRPTRAAGFAAASGVYFFRFLRLGVMAGLVYWWLFGSVHHYLFDVFYVNRTRDLAVERDAFVWRAGLYAAFGALLVAVNLLFDFARVRMVVEDRRSAFGALAAAIRFVRRHASRAFGLYLLNGATFVALIALWALVAPGAGRGGAWIWLTFAATQAYVLARLLLKLHFMASETSLFQASLAHAKYTAAPEPVWPESPAAETIAPITR